MSDRPVFTYQTRLRLAPEQVAALDAYANLYGRAQAGPLCQDAGGDSDGRSQV
ncbi:hypothetical protein [Methylacidimicrobium sp. B4]|uniref:hypothetical protein n=1 Tax=Methylacidimicrobium sp. B4 TaxID=2796139 RepID=UPI001F5D94B6|nr:hypothetical protein [Methylacidimicrobium sp. B4]